MELADYSSESECEDVSMLSGSKGFQEGLLVLPSAEAAIEGNALGSGSTSERKRKNPEWDQGQPSSKSSRKQMESVAKVDVSKRMIPRQLGGRTNVVTEDLERMGLKVKRTQGK